VVRRLVQQGDLELLPGQEAIEDLALFDLLRHPHTDLLGRSWELRDDLTAHDAAYVALALALDAPLVTVRSRSRPDMERASSSSADADAGYFARPRHTGPSGNAKRASDSGFMVIE